MIRYVSGDLLMSDADVVAHGVAPNDPFNQGLAHTLREFVPAMYKDFRHYCQNQHPKPGGLWVWSGAEKPRMVALFTQAAAYEHGSRPGKASLANVSHALKALAAECRQQGWASLALPRLGCGVGGLEWDEVKPLIEQQLGELQIPVLVYETYRPNQHAEEGLAQVA